MRAAPAAIAALLLAGAVVSCSSSRENGGEGARGQDVRPESFGEPIAPNHCRLTGTILQVLDPEAARDATDPCSRFPCRATVRVDSVLGYGSAFPGALSAGQELLAHFQYTLAPSREAFPEETISLPGLGPGDRFGADLSAFEQLAEPGAERGSPRYAVALYRKVH